VDWTLSGVETSAPFSISSFHSLRVAVVGWGNQHIRPAQLRARFHVRTPFHQEAHLGWVACAAQRAIASKLFLAFTLAAASSISIIASMLPNVAASISGVAPRFSRVSTSAVFKGQVTLPDRCCELICRNPRRCPLDLKPSRGRAVGQRQTRPAGTDRLSFHFERIVERRGDLRSLPRLKLYRRWFSGLRRIQAKRRSGRR